RPLVLLHGGLLTIDLTFGSMIPSLAKDYQVIAVELQGHGHTADIDREFSLDALADDVVKLLDHLGIEQADFFGFSLGGMVALALVLARPDRVGRLVLASTHYRNDGYHPEIFDPAQTSPRLPTQADFQAMQDAYNQVAPDPAHFEAFMNKASNMVGSFPGWDAERLRAITAPTLLIVGDTDFVRLDHAVEMFDLIANAHLAVLPSTTHMGVMGRPDVVLPMVEPFLRD
ncbi:MAG TPA: alpha/beta fold hydrolase, partial [Acidimicrobiales bacterium]|nr:alpha/beta fold hydrolase [Acidimicrobiales bacterium]